MTTTTQHLQGIIKRSAKFRNLDAAYRWAYHGAKMQWVVMGDAGEFWVVRPVDAEKLVRAGYEMARS